MLDGSSSVTFSVTLPQGVTESWAFVQWVLDNRRDAQVTVDNNSSLLVNILVPLIPWLLIFGFIWFFVFRVLRRVQIQQPAPQPQESSV